jgi:two-component system NtrC family response regulator
MEKAITGSLLIVDDDPGVAQLLLEMAADQGWAAAAAGCGAEALASLERGLPSLLLLDLGLPDGNGADFLRAWRARWPGLAVVVITGRQDLDAAVECMQAGAYDYVTKPFALQELNGILRAAWRRSALETETQRLQAALEHGRGLDKLLGSSAAMQGLRQRLGQVAAFDIGVLLSGESGTGKEAAAEALHDLSSRRQAPFVSIDCGALPANLLEAELFGHEKGAYTGASSRKRGRVESAQGGVLFLDEVGNLPAAVQPKLLRFLQTRTFQRLGGHEALAVDVRVVTATNVGLREQVAQGRFRQDLYYRLVEMEVALPPLRDREGDILELARAFTLRFSSQFGRRPPELSPAACQAMGAYAWPGNVRELLNAVRGACLLAGALIEPEHLALGRQAGPIQSWKGQRLAEVLEREKSRVQLLMVQRALASNAQALGASARALGIDIKTLHVIMQRHGLEGL